MATRVKSSVELIPADLRVRKAVRERSVGWLFVAAAAAVAVLLAAAGLRYQINRNQEALDDLRARVVEMRQYEPRAQGVLDRLEDQQITRERLGRLLNEPNWTGLLYDIAESTNDAVWVAEISLQRELETAELGFSILARASDERALADFLDALHASRLVQEARLEIADRSGARADSFVEFRVHGQATGGAPAP